MCSAFGVGIQINGDEARLLVSLGVEHGEATFVILLPEDRWSDVINSMMAAAHEGHRINEELSQYVGEARTNRVMEIASRYNSGSN
jgi:hypothetical protein